MQLSEFRDLVRRTFGERMEHATPANVREFLDRIQLESWNAERTEQQMREGRSDAPHDIPSSTKPATWESLINDFFSRSLEFPADRAVIMLWIFALDLAYSGIEDLHSEALDRLFSQRSDHS